jgi:hypothetical protein
MEDGEDTVIPVPLRTIPRRHLRNSRYKSTIIDLGISGSGRFTSGERALGTHSTENCVGPKAGMDDTEKRKLSLLPESNCANNRQNQISTDYQTFAWLCLVRTVCASHQNLDNPQSHCLVVRGEDMQSTYSALGKKQQT